MLPSSTNIISVFSNTDMDGRKIIKKEMSQKMLSGLVPSFFGILLADHVGISAPPELMKCARAIPHSPPISHQSYKFLGSVEFMIKTKHQKLLTIFSVALLHQTGEMLALLEIPKLIDSRNMQR